MKNLSLILLFLLSQNFVFSQTLKINEIMASNASIISDEFGEYNDWFEIYNYGNDTVNIAGFYITDTIGNNDKHQIPAGYAITKIPPQGYLILWADNDTLQYGPTHLSFKLSAGGEQIGIIAPDGLTIIDSVTFGQQITDISYGRYPNGNNNWLYFNFPTPGASNSNVSIEEDNAQKTFQYFPNPVSENVVSFNEEISFKLFNINGKFINYFENVTEMHTNDLQQGMYLMMLDNGMQAKLVILNK
ncbi:MAG: lamin tail domain-containing protein [Bacteroidales bacterium]|nr:lamin tail domain-containing protein [Bacteroidales bacterium]